jgi:hypothetical protein
VTAAPDQTPDGDAPGGRRRRGLIVVVPVVAIAIVAVIVVVLIFRRAAARDSSFPHLHLDGSRSNQHAGSLDIW